MKVLGRRKDGALNLNIGAGMSVLLRGTRQSPPMDESVAMKHGPWFPVVVTMEERKALEKQMRMARVIPLKTFNLGISFDEQRDRVLAAVRLRLGIPANTGYYPGPMMDCYIPQNGIGEDWVVYCFNGKTYGLAYDIAGDGTVTFPENPVEVGPSWDSMPDRANDAKETDQETEFDRNVDTVDMRGGVPVTRQPLVRNNLASAFKTRMAAAKAKKLGMAPMPPMTPPQTPTSMAMDPKPVLDDNAALPAGDQNAMDAAKAKGAEAIAKSDKTTVYPNSKLQQLLEQHSGAATTADLKALHKRIAQAHQDIADSDNPAAPAHRDAATAHFEAAAAYTTVPDAPVQPTSPAKAGPKKP